MHLPASSFSRCPERWTPVFQSEWTGHAALPVRYFPVMVEFLDNDWSEAELDEEFPFGDGTADTEAHIHCPHCGAPNEIALDPGSGDDQEYVEDCHVCCRAILMYVKYGRDGRAAVEVYASDS